jgi:hypothetical protein
MRKLLLELVLHYATRKDFGTSVYGACEIEVSRGDAEAHDDYVRVDIRHAPSRTKGSVSGWTVGDAKATGGGLHLQPAVARRLGKAILRAADSAERRFECFSARAVPVNGPDGDEATIEVEDGPSGLIEDD